MVDREGLEQPEASAPSTTSKPIPVEATHANDQAMLVPEPALTDLHIEGASHDAHSEQMCPQYDEYTTLLKKHIGVLEGELSRIKGPQRSVLSLDLFRDWMVLIADIAPVRNHTWLVQRTMYLKSERMRRTSKYSKPEFAESHHGNGEKSSKVGQLIQICQPSLSPQRGMVG